MKVVRTSSHENECDEKKKNNDRHSQHHWPCDEEREDCAEEQTHVHEFEGSVKLAEFEADVHNHRFAGISGEVIPCGDSHIHKIFTKTDFFDHFHFICVLTGKAICVGNGKHVHFATDFTSCNDGHRHEFQFATLIDSPLLPEPDPEEEECPS